MKRPTWATVVGILALIFGIFGVLAGAQEMAIPSMLELQEKFMEDLAQSSENASPNASITIEDDGKTQTMHMAPMFEHFKESFQIPDWYASWVVVIGLVSMIISAIYALSGMFLLMVKTFAIRFFYTSITISIIWAIVQILFYSQAASGFLLAQIPASIFSIVIDVILLITVLSGNKDAFQVRNESSEQS